MKKTLLLFVLLFALSSAKASDTLTIRQIYNFDVGDTFDYRISSEVDFGNGNGAPHTTIGFARYCISGKIISPDSQTVTYYRVQPLSNSLTDTLIFTNLDSSIIYYDTTSNPIFYNYQFQTGRDSLNLVTNTFSGATTDNGFTRTYTEGLGRSYFRHGYGNPIDGGGEDMTALVYYSHGGMSHGTPYYWANGERYIHYTPLPETCAVWTMTSGPLQEQIHTGNVIQHGGHRYVEMIYRSYNPSNGRFVNDSLLGYFYNDSMAKSVYYVQTILSAPRTLYDFSSTYSSLSCTGLYDVYQDHIAGRTLAHWTAEGDCIYQYGRYCFFDYIEGIGGTAGLINVTEWGGHYVSYLTSLCVCGTVIYPDTATKACTLLTSINESSEAKSISIYPSPSNSILSISISDLNKPFNISLFNLLGQEMYSSTISETETTHDISSLPSGIYTWRIVSDNTIVKTGKIVKE